MSSQHQSGTHQTKPITSVSHPSGPYLTGPQPSGPDSSIPHLSSKDTEKKLEASKRTPPTPRSVGLSGIEGVIELRPPTTQDESTVSGTVELWFIINNNNVIFD